MRADAGRLVMPAATALLAVGAFVPVAAAQESDVCTVAMGRGATTLGGATGTMTVRNVGHPVASRTSPCPSRGWPRAGSRSWKVPAQGRLEVVQPNIVTYTPRAGFTGPDEFAYGGSGPGREGRTLPFSVRVSVRVIGPGEALR